MDSLRLSSQLTCNCQLVVLDSTTSTNDEIITQARRLKDQGYSTQDVKISPLVVISRSQTAGRGRLGRHWESPAGGLYLSVLLWMEAYPHASLSLLVAMAVRDALQCFQTGEVRLKWPNDVLSSAGKLVGILVEVKQASRFFSDSSDANAEDTSDTGQFAVVGIGINVNRPENGALDTAAYLDDDPGFCVQLEDLGAAVIDHLLSHYASWQADGCSFEGKVADYTAHMAQINERVCVKDALGNEIAAGTVQGVDEQGRLLLLGASGIIAVAAGEVTLRNP